MMQCMVRGRGIMAGDESEIRGCELFVARASSPWSFSERLTISKPVVVLGINHGLEAGATNQPQRRCESRNRLTGYCGTGQDGGR